MQSQAIQVFIVVLRESFEALLVVGILNACISRMSVLQAGRARAFLVAGVLAGLAVSVAMGNMILRLSDELEGDGLEYFQTGMIAVAAALMLQAAFWVRRQNTLARPGATMSRYDAASLAVLAMIAVAREGSETVVFVYSVMAAAGENIDNAPVYAVLGGFGVAIGLYFSLQLGSRSVPRRAFFRVTEFLLLLLAGSLVMSGLDKLISVGLISPLSAPLWNSSWLVDDSAPFGGLLSMLTGYRARPELMLLLVFGGYWAAVCALLARRADRSVTR